MNSKKNLGKVVTTLGVAAATVSIAAVAHADTTYTVKSGDTLSSISYKFAKDASLVDQIAKDNDISDKDTIHAGEKLVIKTDDSKATKSNNADDQDNNQNGGVQLGSDEQAAKDWIAYQESRGSYTAQNGQYYGKYQLSMSYLGGDLSAQNQEAVAQQYMQNRYGSWQAAKAHWLANGWW
ncbi:MAG: LysM domain-containing protein [Limosilactobacillus sp.]|uniref:LysM peptidoglycan-binding domain-containing protein n=1 Tax=Limosilactobacillus sp. TaxID=2773925 RepID=UPI0026FC4765|nr:LysM domain-containing protein [Limosilactobacillus sp.]